MRSTLLHGKDLSDLPPAVNSRVWTSASLTSAQTNAAVTVIKGGI
jgi:hypothetical protein